MYYEGTSLVQGGTLRQEGCMGVNKIKRKETLQSKQYQPVDIETLIETGCGIFKEL